MKTLPQIASAFLVALAVASAHAQTAPPSQSAPDEVPGIRTNVNEVSLDLVVHDRHQNAILNLKPDELVVTDNNIPVKLNGFHLVTGAESATRGHLVTLLFDPFKGATAKSTRNLALKILSVLPESGYSFSVLDLAGRLRLLQGFTADRDAAVRAVNVETESKPITITSSINLSLSLTDDRAAEQGRLKAAADAERNLLSVALTGSDIAGRRVDAKERELAQSLATAMRESQTITQQQHTRLQLASLLALVKSQHGIDDRKVLIYFTYNQQLDPAAKKMLETITDAATRAGVTIYTIDMDAINWGSKNTDAANALLNAQAPATGVAAVQEAGTPIQGAGTPGPGSTGPVWGPQQDIQVMTDFMRNGFEDLSDPFADTKSPMAAFSKATGGSYIDGQNPTKKPLEQMVRDLNTYYEAEYVPPFKEYDGKFRTIAVKPLRAGLSIQTKKGYFALASGADAGIQPFEGPLLKSFSDPVLPTDLKFQAAVIRFGDLPDGNSNTLAVEIPLAELEPRDDPKSHLSSAHVSIVAQIKDQDGTVIEHFSEDINKRGAAETLDRDHAATVSMVRHFIGAPGKYTMEIAAMDQNSGKAGAVRTGFEIPTVAGPVSLSDMVLVRSMEGLKDEDLDPLEPLRYEHKRVTPNLSGELPASGKDVSLFFILHPDPASNDPLTLEMELIRNGKAGKRTPLLHADGEHAPVPYLASIGSRSLAPGSYEVKAFISQGGKTAEQSQTFTIAGTPGTESAQIDSNWMEGVNLGESDANQPAEAAPHAASELAITTLKSPAPAPAADEAHALIQAARERALSFTDTLPNFMCTEVTKRSVDMKGDGKWRPIDTLVELLSYRDRVETRTTLEVNDRASNTGRVAMKGSFSAGEFGGVLQAVFRDESKADFQWKETDALTSGPSAGTLQVYAYRIDRGNSSFSVSGPDGRPITVGFHGQVYIDNASRRVRRVTIVADDVPADFPTQDTSIAVDYDFVAINGLKYLMPVSAELKLKQGQHEMRMNTMEFQDYKRFVPSADGSARSQQ